VQDRYYLERNSLHKLSMRGLGYSMTEICNCSDLSFDLDSYQDIKFFDLIELFIIFTKEDRRSSFIDRINEIFREEGDRFIIHDFLIIDKRAGGLRPLIPLIKDLLLRDKLSELLSESLLIGSNSGGEVSARISADVLQILFSDPDGKIDTKTYASDLCNKIATRWTTEDHVNDFSNLINETVLNAKKLGNEISNIRHTDGYTIKVEFPGFYKLISNNNTSIAELVILTFPEKYLIRQDPDGIKKSYLEKYSIDKEFGKVISKEEENMFISPDDLPF
jgi:hypothetical protein